MSEAKFSMLVESDENDPFWENGKWKVESEPSGKALSKTFPQKRQK